MPTDPRKSLPPKWSSKPPPPKASPKPLNNRFSVPNYHGDTVRRAQAAAEGKQAGPESKLTPEARIAELEEASKSLQAQLKDQDAEMAAFKESARRTATAEATHRKQKVEVERLKEHSKKLEEELKNQKESFEKERQEKNQGCKNLNKRHKEMADRLFQTDKKARSSAERIPQLKAQINDLTAKLNVATEDASRVASSSKESQDEIARLRESSAAKDALLNANAKLIETLEQANNKINTQYTAMAADMTAKDSKIEELEDEHAQLEEKRKNLEEKCKKLQNENADSSIDFLIVDKLRKSLHQAESERDQTTFDAMNGLGKFQHLKPKPAEKLGAVVFAGVETKPVDAAPFDSTLLSAPILLASLPSTPPTIFNPSMNVSQHLHVAIHITTPAPQKLPLIKRLRSVLSKASTITIDAPPGVEQQIWKAVDGAESDHAAQRAKVFELSELMFSQVRKIEEYREQNERALKGVSGKCMVSEHKVLADTVRALEEKLEMQTMLLAWPPRALGLDLAV